jgi:hypothetical protein
VGNIADAAFTEVPVVRFRKQLSTRPMAAAPARARASPGSSTKGHAVFVVNAPHLVDFLEDFDIDEDALRRLR